MAKQLDKVYDPKHVEDRLYNFWQENGYFRAEVDPNKPAFSIVMPPPNVTGQLHLGHAFDSTLQDILTRVKRMQGYSALWLPGTDHAGIATQIKVEENLRVEQGLTRYDLGREKFLDLVWDWKNKYGDRIVEQQKKLGTSCDWSRARFTMDDVCAKAVREVFVRLYEKGLIYKGSRIINWCPNCTTALSDAEVEYAEKAGHFWHIKYPIVGTDDYLTIATTRPETLLGDSAVAVHPDDERYQHLIGKTVLLPLMNREIPIIADEYVEMDFGTGCVKITPSHDPNDFEVGKRHNLEEILVMDDNAKINENGGKYQGLDRYEARKQIVADLEAEGYLLKIEDHAHNVGSCYRCGTVVEPITSAQWFVKMGPLAEEAIRVVKDGTIQFVPDRFSKIYLNWMENVHDWCISRQLWWGHRIPAFYCDECGHVNVSREDPTVCEKCGCTHLTQDEDVLDTWFSSALWPFSTLGWPEKTPELDYFYPTSVMVTGYDIIFFWVARMIFSSMEQLKQEPFKTVFIHGIIRDAQGRKMSKSLGNGVDPLEVVEKYGADALRFTLATGNSPGNDTRFQIERIEANRNFANKIWNASRFVLMNLTDETPCMFDAARLELPDKWILTRYNQLVREVTENIDHYELGVAAQKLYDFIWDDFCDWYIELVKPRLSEGAENRDTAERVLCYVLSNTLKLLHPFMPFITEEIWQTLPHEGESIMISEWPKADDALIFSEAAATMEVLMDAIRGIRNRRAEMNVPPSKKAHLIVVSESEETRNAFSAGSAFLSKLAYASEIDVVSDAPTDISGMVSVITNAATLFIPMSELIDLEKEIARLSKEKEKALKDVNMLSGKLSNEGFLAKAPEAVVAAEREKLANAQARLDNIEESLKQLG
ncbi:MAG: valine--tRNA ligase [Ruminococcaceae bacterium]|nr:valine--tRNA ligase [Oscillospiraceae bacterium]